MLVFVQMFVVSLPCMYLFLFLGMSKVETSPLTPVRSKEVWLLPLFLDGFRYSLRCINKRGIQLRGGEQILGRYTQRSEKGCQSVWHLSVIVYPEFIASVFHPFYFLSISFWLPAHLVTVSNRQHYFSSRLFFIPIPMAYCQTNTCGELIGTK